jgi:hypothetical protein
VVPDDACPGSCNGPYRRRRALYEAAVAGYARQLETRAGTDPIPEPPEAPDIQPWTGNPWCLKCQGAIRSELLDLDDLAALIAVIPPLAKPEETSAGRVSGSRDKPSSSARMDDLDELGEWLRSWEAIARGEEDPRPRRGFLATERTTITAWLTEHFDPLITSPDVAADFGEEVRRWHRDLARRASAGRMTRHQNKPCPRCCLYTLWMIIGEDYIRCCNEDCKRALSREEYDALDQVA